MYLFITHMPAGILLGPGTWPRFHDSFGPCRSCNAVGTEDVKSSCFKSLEKMAKHFHSSDLIEAKGFQRLRAQECLL